MIRKVYLQLFIICMVMQMYVGVRADDGALQFHIQAHNHEAMPLLVMVIGTMNNQMQEVVTVLKKDLAFTQQFAVEVRNCDSMGSKSAFKALYNEGYSLVIFLNASSDGYEWRLYDTSFDTMIKGKRYHKRGTLARGWGHNIADMLWPELTAQDGFFSTKIAYCKELFDKHKHRLKHIYIADYDGSNEQLVVSTPTINVAPRFNKDAHNPMLFYSESTNANIRLMLADFKGKARVASNFPGVNMLPALSQDGKTLVYCASHGHGLCQLYLYDKKTFKKITDNGGNNVSPTLSDDGNLLFFCSDYENGKPQIYCHNFTTGLYTRISDDTAACYCPSYNNKKEQLVYVKMIKGTLQLCVYDAKTGHHRQLTFDEGNKDECCWSPCGNFVLYAVEKGNKGRIALYTLSTGKSRFLTAAQDVCSYPTWSGQYASYVAA